LEFFSIVKMPVGGKKLDTSVAIQLQKELMDCDADGDGQITVKELGNVLRGLKAKLKVSETAIKKVLREIDADGDGTINLKEYYDNMGNSDSKNLIYRALMQRSKARQQFEKYDTDGSGSISVDEMKLVFEERTGRKLDKKEVKAMLKEMDEDDDGQINYEEFLALLCK
jgi:Ca2+-binding EF-hand superfamily protein